MSPEFSRLLAILFAAGRAVSASEIAKGTGASEDSLLRQLQSLRKLLDEGGQGVALEEVGGGWRLIIHPSYVETVQRVLHPRPPRLSPAAMEVLAIVAYHQPITRPEVEAMRGKNSDAVLEGLMERRLVQVVGVKEAVGKPRLYGTTQRFLELFGLSSLAELPPLEEGPALLLRD